MAVAVLLLISGGFANGSAVGSEPPGPVTLRASDAGPVAFRAAVSLSRGTCAAADSAAVTVVIDYAALGGGIDTRCASGLTARSHGDDALAAAGFSWSAPTSQPGGFVCRLNGRPSTSESFATTKDPNYTEACVNTPPTDAYWTYWQSSGDGSWHYSDNGLTTSRVTLGGFEGWSFSTGSKQAPGVSPVAATTAPPPADPPPAAPPTTSTPVSTTTAPPPPAATTAPSTSSSSRRPTTPSPSSPRSSPDQVASSEPAETVPPTDPATSADAATSADPVPSATSDSATASSDPSPAATSTAFDSTTPSNTTSAGSTGIGEVTDGSGAGPLWATLGGVVVVAALSGAAILLARRRRSADEQLENRD